MQFRYHIRSETNSTNWKKTLLLNMNLQHKQTAFHARQVCTPFTHKQIILARLQWLFPVLYCTSGPFSRAEKLGRCQKWLQLPPGLRLDDCFKMNHYTGSHQMRKSCPSRHALLPDSLYWHWQLCGHRSETGKKCI